MNVTWGHLELNLRLRAENPLSHRLSVTCRSVITRFSFLQGLHGRNGWVKQDGAMPKATKVMLRDCGHPHLRISSSDFLFVACS
jgi:hypothetical protein